MFQGLRTVVVHVDDLTAAKNWYTTALGVAPYYDTPYYVGFNVGGYELGLHPMEGQTRTAGDRTVAYWGVPNVDAAIAHLTGLGAVVVEKPQDVGGGIVIGAVRDPFGNVLGVIDNPQFGKAGPNA